MRAARAFASAAKAAAGAGEKTVPWDMTSGMKSIVEMGPAFLLVIGGATTLFLGIPKLYGSKLPRTMEADWKKAEMMKMHAKVCAHDGCQLGYHCAMMHHARL